MGATQFIPRADGSFNEVGASITTGAIITTGGGFSQVLSQPDYQTQAVNVCPSSVPVMDVCTFRCGSLAHSSTTTVQWTSPLPPLV